MALAALPDVQIRVVHGYERAFVMLGEGPPLLLLHGLGCNHKTWLPVLAELAEHHTVIAPDLLGHGQSAKPRADYSLGGYANGMRDLLTVLGIDRVTVVGHSFGGGVAMQFAYQFPERAERIVLVAPGGLGRDVTPMLRALTLPGAGAALGVAAAWPLRTAANIVLGTAARAGLPHTVDVRPLLKVLGSMTDPAGRDAFLHVLRAAVDWKGQVVTMIDRSYLAENTPICVIWGDRDTVIPVAHAEAAATAIPGARVEVLSGAGHFPHVDRPEEFAGIVREFVAQTPPSKYNKRRWQVLLRQGRDGLRVATPDQAAITA